MKRILLYTVALVVFSIMIVSAEAADVCVTIDSSHSIKDQVNAFSEYINQLPKIQQEEWFKEIGKIEIGKQDSSTIDTSSLLDWLYKFLIAFIPALLVFIGSWLISKHSKSNEIREAVAALRFEVGENLKWIQSCKYSHIYLRDEAWVLMKNKGYISYLRSPIPLKVIDVYLYLHVFNEQQRLLREGVGSDEIVLEEYKVKYIDTAKELVSLFDFYYKKITKNFK